MGVSREGRSLLSLRLGDGGGIVSISPPNLPGQTMRHSVHSAMRAGKGSSQTLVSLASCRAPLLSYGAPAVFGHCTLGVPDSSNLHTPSRAGVYTPVTRILRARSDLFAEQRQGNPAEDQDVGLSRKEQWVEHLPHTGPTQVHLRYPIWPPEHCQGAYQE